MCIFKLLYTCFNIKGTMQHVRIFESVQLSTSSVRACTLLIPKTTNVAVSTLTRRGIIIYVWNYHYISTCSANYYIWTAFNNKCVMLSLYPNCPTFKWFACCLCRES